MAIWAPRASPSGAAFRRLDLEGAHPYFPRLIRLRLSAETAETRRRRMNRKAGAPGSVLHQENQPSAPIDV